jgi:hypothetical protein
VIEEARKALALDRVLLARAGPGLKDRVIRGV